MRHSLAKRSEEQRLNSSHVEISYAVFCLKKKKKAVALHSRNSLNNGQPALPEPLGDPGPERDDALLLTLEDGPQIHLRGVDQPVRGHLFSLRSRWYAVAAGRGEARGPGNSALALL